MRAGMVFISMSQDELLGRTAQYQIQYAPLQRSVSWMVSPDGRPHQREQPRPNVISVRHHGDGTTSTRSRRSLYRTEDDEDFRTPEMPQEFTSNQPDFNITTECSDDEDDHDHSRPRAPRRTPNRIGSLAFESPDFDTEELAPFDYEEFDMYGPPSIVHPERHGHLGLTEAWEAHNNATQEAVRAVGGALLVPHAKFFIEKGKSKCTIRFDPPVSGRFMLLKMWSSRHDLSSNIDIQSVIARGYAGPRYFPSVELR